MDGSNNSRNNGNSSSEGSRYFVGAILRTVSPEDVTRHFEQYGRVRRFELSKDDSGKSRGYGFVVFEHQVEIPTTDKHEIGTANLTVNKVGGNAGPNFPALQKQVRAGEISTVANTAQANSPAQTTPSHTEDSHQPPRPEPPKRPRIESESPQRQVSLPPQQRQSAPRVMAQLTASLREAARYNSTVRGPYHSGQHAQPKQPPPPPTAAPVKQPLAPVPTSSPQAPPPTVPGQPPTPKYVCIPFELCPPHFLRDPRVFCAELDPTRVASLVISTSASELSSTAFLMPSYSPAAQDMSVPPPPGPPPGPPPPLPGRF